jgi:Flp pilus assembly protein TadD
MRKQAHHQPSHEEALWRKAARCARRGEHRKAALAMREAVALEPTAANYCRLGSMLDRAGRRSESVEALKQSLYLFRQGGMNGRARTVARMILALDPHDRSAARAA